MIHSQRSRRIHLVFGMFFLSAIFVLSQNAFSQSTISGFVYDKQRNPIIDTQVELLDDYYRSIKRTKTDGVGRYSFDGLRDGRYSVRVYAFRYDLEDQTQETEIRSQNIRGGEGSTFVPLDFYLLPRKGGLAESELGVVFAQDIPDEAKKLYEKGIEDISKKRVDEGIASLNEAIKIFPDYFLALYRVGKELYMKQRYEDAAHFLYKAAGINAKSAAVFYYLGSSFFKMGKDYHAASLASLNQAHILAPSSIQILWALGRAERSQGKFAEAEKHLLQAKKISGGGIPEIHLELAMLYSENLKKYKEAADELELYIKTSKMNDADANKNRKIVASLREKAKNQPNN